MHRLFLNLFELWISFVIQLKNKQGQQFLFQFHVMLLYRQQQL